MFKSIALSALLALGTSQLPQGVDAAAALTKSISDNDTTTTYTSLDPQVRTLTARLPLAHGIHSPCPRQRASPQEYALDLSYIINGEKTNAVPCDNDSPDARAACVRMWRKARDCGHVARPAPLIHIVGTNQMMNDVYKQRISTVDVSEISRWWVRKSHSAGLYA
jgi:hypothetical protein